MEFLNPRYIFVGSGTVEDMLALRLVLITIDYTTPI